MDVARPARKFSLSRLALASSEARFVAVVSVILLVLTSLPTLYGYLSTPQDRWFSGVVYNVHDTSQYLSWMRESGTAVFIENRLTSEPNEAIYLNLHWWIPGRVAHVLGLSLPQIYQVFRFASVPLATAAIYVLCTAFFDDKPKRRFAFLLAILTSGLGWVWVVQKYATGAPDVLFPHDVYTTPGNTFWVMVASPHLTLALALTVFVLFLSFRGYQNQRFSVSVMAGLAALFLGWGHIYDLVTIWAVLAIFGLLLTLRDGFRWRTFFRLFVVVLLSAPSALYWAWVSSDAHPMWQEALAQYDNLGAFTPDPAHLVILLGLTFLIALLTFDGLVPLKGRSDRDLFVKSWFIVVPLLVYLPLHFEIMLLTGYQLPMAILATAGIFDHVLPWLRERWPSKATSERLLRALPALFLAVVSLTNLYLLGWRVLDMKRHGYPFYLHADDRAALGWLEENAHPEDVVLSAFETGHYIPGLSGTRPFLANAVMTLSFNQKLALVQRFYGGDMTPEEQQSFLHGYGIDFLLWGPAERVLGPFNPDESEFLIQTFTTDEVSIYRVP